MGLAQFVEDLTQMNLKDAPMGMDGGPILMLRKAHNYLKTPTISWYEVVLGLVLLGVIENVL